VQQLGFVYQVTYASLRVKSNIFAYFGCPRHTLSMESRITQIGHQLVTQSQEQILKVKTAGLISAHKPGFVFDIS